MSKRVIAILIFVTILILGIIIYSKYNAHTYDPEYVNQWNLYDEYGIDADKMWECLDEFDQKDIVTIAIIDTGVDFMNSELEGRNWTNASEITDNEIDDDKNGYIDDYSGYSFVNEEKSNISINSYHGTSCAGIIAALHNDILLEGVVKDLKVSIMSVKVLDNTDNLTSNGNIEDVISGIKYAEKNGADICNLSFSTYKYSEELKECMENSNMLFVSSAGNKSSFRRINVDEKPIYPACFDLPNIISVVGTNRDGELSDISNYGRNSIDVAAPGEDICVLVDENNVGLVSGVSVAVPQVTAIAAILLSYDSFKANEIKDIIISSVKPCSKLEDKCKAGGIVNGYNAIEEMKERRKRDGKN